eukprot:TRINITY_DN3122_c0_g1_i1.p1 TRINITY_DN3122_c0_g1~~TRINITY_DN3122_c0_g1_i1.p1  ORF type:complete len:630 (-),score=105.96 TRINITY_DN3122_c0_g1_i1:1000-2889(-)
MRHGSTRSGNTLRVASSSPLRNQLISSHSSTSRSSSAVRFVKPPQTIVKPTGKRVTVEHHYYQQHHQKPYLPHPPAPAVAKTSSMLQQETPLTTGTVEPLPSVKHQPVVVVQPQQQSPVDDVIWAKVADQYTLGRTLAIGTYGRIRLAEHKSTGTPVAVKMLCRKKLQRAGHEAIRLAVREVEILKRILPHSNVIKLFQIFRSKRAIFLVLELARGGELYDLLMKKGRLSEPEAASVMWQLLKGVKHCHGLGIVHRDIKPENLLLLEPRNSSTTFADGRKRSASLVGDPSGLKVKIADFGLAASVLSLGLPVEKSFRSSSLRDSLMDIDTKSNSPVEDDHNIGELDFQRSTAESIHEVADIESLLSSQLLVTTCGSPSYVAPEVLGGRKYLGPPVDMWSCGIVLYTMLCGELPFEDDSLIGLYSKIKKGGFKVPSHLSSEALSLIQGLLVLEPEARFSVDNALRHSFFKKNAEFLFSLDHVVTSDSLEEFKSPVSWDDVTFDLQIDEEVLLLMGSRGFNVPSVMESVHLRKFDRAHSTYEFLKHNRTESIRKFIERNPAVNFTIVDAPVVDLNDSNCIGKNNTADNNCGPVLSSSPQKHQSEKDASVKSKGSWLTLPVFWKPMNKSGKF